MPVKVRQVFHYLPPRTLETLRNVEFVARSLVEGALAGLHRSPFTGFSAEFSEYRKYCPGDAVRFVDWLVYAKTDRYYIKQFQEETNTRCYVALDLSNSMSLGSGGEAKFNYACYLAAAFLYLMHRQRDAVGLFTYNDRVVDYWPAKGTTAHLRQLLLHLEGLKPNGRSDAVTAFERMAQAVPRRSLIVAFSDFLEFHPGFGRALQHFRYCNSEVVLFQVLDPLETDFPFKGLIEFRDLETAEVIEVESEDYRETYQEALAGHNAGLRQACHAMNISFEALSTRTPFERALLAYFFKREKLF